MLGICDNNGTFIVPVLPELHLKHVIKATMINI